MNIAIAAALLAAAGAASALPAQEASSPLVEQAVPAKLFSGSRTRDALRVQVLLDRSRHSPGVIDGVMGGNTERAIMAFEREHGLQPDGKLDRELLDALERDGRGEILTRYTITDEDVAGPFEKLPTGMEEMSKLKILAYESPAEALAEKFHMAKSFLEALNPATDFSRAGSVITVVARAQQGPTGPVARIEVDKAKSRLRAYAADGSIVATYPATVGSADFPSPDGAMEVRAIAPAPVYYFNPEGRDWGPDKRLTIAAGPNNPVGSTWIDLTKEGYGIHGSPDPRLIGKTSSHGCVRLTNWDVQALSKLVSPGTEVVFLSGGG